MYSDQKKVKEKKESWQSVRHQWKSQIQDLSQCIISGNTDANPMEGIQTCNTCQFSGLCRIKKTELAH